MHIIIINRVGLGKALWLCFKLMFLGVCLGHPTKGAPEGAPLVLGALGAPRRHLVGGKEALRGHQGGAWGEPRGRPLVPWVPPRRQGGT